jgi:hypothetical protein
MVATDLELLEDLWEEVNNSEIIPFGNDAFLNKESLTMFLLNDLVMITVDSGQYFVSFSCEVDEAFIIADVVFFLFEKTGVKPTVIDNFYIQFVEEKSEPNFLMGDEARVVCLKDKCFETFRELLQTKNMGDFLEDLDVEEMVKC